MNRRTAWAVGGLLVAATTAAVFWRVLAGELLVGRDILRVYYPLHQFWAEQVRSGQLPQWYPYDALGQPFISMTISGTFHPTKLIYLLLPLGPALSAHTLLCYPIAALGAGLCARRLGCGRAEALFAAVSYAFCGYLVGSSNNLLYLMGAATLPWALWTADRCVVAPSIFRGLTAALVLASIALAGDVQAFIVIGAGVLLLGLFRIEAGPLLPRVARAVAMVAGAFALAAVQWLPSVSAAGERAGINPPDVAQLFSLHPVRLLELLVGPIFVDANTGTVVSGAVARLFEPAAGAFWVDSIGIGAPALVLAAVGLLAHRRGTTARGMTAAGVMILLLALGRHLPLYELLYRVLPAWRSFRYPEKLLPPLLFLLSLAAAAGLARLLNDRASRERAWKGLLALALALTAAAFFSPGSGDLPAADLAALSQRWTTLALLAAAALGAVALCLRTLPSGRAAVGVVLIQATLLTVLHAPLPQTSPRNPLTAANPMVAHLRGQGLGEATGGFRVQGALDQFELPPREGWTPLDLTSQQLMVALEPCTPALFHLESGNFYLPAASARVTAAMLRGPLWLDRLAPLYSVRFLTATVGAATGLRDRQERLVVAFSEWDVALLENAAALPRTFLAQPVCVPDGPAALAALQAAEPRAGEVLVECGGHRLASGGEGPSGATRVLSHQPGAVSVEVDALRPAILVLNDALANGWTAVVDGQPAEIVPANFAVRGVPVPAGRHRVTFTYQTPGLAAGMAVSVTVLLIGILAGLAERRLATVARDAVRHPE